MTTLVTRPAGRAPGRAAPLLRGLDWWLLVAVLTLTTLSTLLVWSATSHRDVLTGGDPTAYLRKQSVNVAVGWC